MLKILVVEDDINKLRNIITALQQVPGCQLENIDQTGYANEAKRLIKEYEYDLLVLDIAIPDRPDQVPTAEGGIRLLEEILDRQIQYCRPKHIVGLTAFPEILKKVAHRFEEGLWMVLQYEASSVLWAEQLQRKVEYILLARRSQPIPDYDNYLGIIAALHTPELTALLDTVPWGWSSSPRPADSSHYFQGTFEKNGGKRNVVAVASSRMGLTAASVASMKLITSFRPRYLAMIGMAAGIMGECQLGDIVVADPSWDWGSGKIAAGAAGARFQQAPHQVSLDSFVRSKLNLLEQDSAALDSIRRSWTASSIESVLRMHIGPVASGSAVLADKKATKEIVKQHRKLLAIDMETYAVYAAAFEASLPNPTVFSIKSVCDYADEKKNDGYQKYASFVSAQTLKVFVERYL